MRGVLMGIAGLCLAGCSKSPALGALDSYQNAALARPGDAIPWLAYSAEVMLGNTLRTHRKGPPLAFHDPDCPKVTRMGTRSLYEGGCTSSDGDHFVGTIQVDEEAPDAGTGTVTFSGFGEELEIECLGGRKTLRVTEDTTLVVSKTDTGIRFELDHLRKVSDFNGCDGMAWTLAAVYTGTRSGDLWKGRGTVGDSRNGKVDVETVDEVDDDRCLYEAESGSTIVTSRSGGRAAVTYDGATLCGDSLSATATWTFNGEEQGVIANNCSSSAGAVAWAASLLVLLRARRRGLGAPPRRRCREGKCAARR